MTIRRFAFALIASLAALAASHQQASADLVDLEWDVPCCAMQGASHGTAMTTMVICNCTMVTSDYEWLLKTTETGVSFSPASGTVTLAPGECIEIPVTVHCPVQPTPGMHGFIFTACVTNLTTGATFEDDGSVLGVTEYKVTPPDPVVPVVVTGSGTPVAGPPTTVSLVVSNIGSSGKDGVSINPVSMSQDIEVVPLWTNPLFPPPGGSMIVEAEVRSLREHEPFVFYDVILMYDGDGDGTEEAAGSFRAHSVLAPCIGDLDGDGTVGSADLAQLIGRWGPCP